jgi:hypothetical protein
MEVVGRAYYMPEAALVGLFDSTFRGLDGDFVVMMVVDQ